MAGQDCEKKEVQLPLEFVSLFAHEVRNPLNALAAVGSILSREPKAEMLPWLGSTVERQVDRVSFLVDILLDGARLAAGCFKVVEESVSLSKILNEVLEDFGESLQRAQITVLREETTNFSDVLAERRRLRSSLIAIVENVVSYVPSGGRVRFWIIPTESSVELLIQDTGKGMNEEDIEALERVSTDRIFERGARGHLGLSLILVKAFVESVGGLFSLRGRGDNEWTGIVLKLSFHRFYPAQQGGQGHK